MTLKDKEIDIYTNIQQAPVKAFAYKDVKEAVLEFENYLSDRQDEISKSKPKKDYDNFDLILLIQSIEVKHKEIFGEFEE